MLSILVLLAGCTQCDCLDLPQPDGPRVDMTARAHRVEAAFSGLAGTVRDSPHDREGARYEPCAYEGLAFEFVVDVGDPDCGRAGCARARAATFPLSGALALDDQPIPVTGAVEVQSWADGIRFGGYPESTLDIASPDLPAQATELDLGDWTVDAVYWDLRFSDDDAEPAVWESCLLAPGA